jgi:hypothetical protein
VGYESASTSKSKRACIKNAALLFVECAAQTTHHASIPAASDARATREITMRNEIAHSLVTGLTKHRIKRTR